MAMIVFGRFFLEAFARKEKAAGVSDQHDLHKREQGILPEFVYWGKLLAGVLAVTALALRFHCLFMIAPPLIVAFVELSRPNQSLRQNPVKVLLLLFLAASAGVIWLHVIITTLHGPLWLFSGLSLFSVFLLYNALQVSFPPAAAISLLPVLVPAANFWIYPLHVLMGSTLFIFMGIFYFREVKPEDSIVTEN
jgi:hypothetical protein